jgi:hypothetical protein
LVIVEAILIFRHCEEAEGQLSWPEADEAISSEYRHGHDIHEIAALVSTRSQ